MGTKQRLRRMKRWSVQRMPVSQTWDPPDSTMQLVEREVKS
jgi:hypothetical protein